MANLNYRYNNIKLVVCDVDGTLTDGGIYITENGDEFKKFNSKDGMAISRLLKMGIQVGFISASIAQNIVKRRAEMLKVPFCYVGDKNKAVVISEWLKKLNLKLENVAYIGDDINDLDIMKIVGISACPFDSAESVKKTADIILNRKGGEACFREFVERLFDLEEEL